MFKTIVKTVVAVALLGYLFSRVDLEAFGTILDEARVPVLIGMFFTFIPGSALSVWKWKILLRAQGIDSPGFFGLWKLYLQAVFYSNFLPGDIGGDVVRCYQVGKRSGKMAESVAAVFLERFSGLFLVFVYGAIGLGMAWERVGRTRILPVCAAAVLLFFIACGAFVLWHRVIHRVLSRPRRFAFMSKLAGKARRLYESLILYRKRPVELAGTAAISVLFQLYAVFYLWGLAYSLRIPVSVQAAFLVLPFSTIVSLAPVSISSLGVREGAFVYFLSLFGLSVTEALTLALLFRVSVLFTGLVGGVLLLADSVPGFSTSPPAGNGKRMAEAMKDSEPPRFPEI